MFAKIEGINTSSHGDTVEEVMRMLCNRSFKLTPDIILPPIRLENHWCVDCDEVYPNLFISNAATAKNKAFLKALGITHILNPAEGEEMGMVNTDSEFYRQDGIKYLGLRLMDLPSTPISSYFPEVTNFIEEGISSGGKVLVHCLMGISRSSTCAIAYLMIKKNMTLQQAVRQIRAHRDIRPNYGFLHQLADLNHELRHKS
ncbi:hypothetical protein V9T40_003548 [Parthenolecanium corni]|uniref:Dual specificity protein phosphatase n=1 Tax=Parthenolecanium corni TaxID=536013 RepID=A0AAN9TQU8_9HEMI